MIPSSSSLSSGAWGMGTTVESRRRNLRIMIRNRNNWFVLLVLLVVLRIVLRTGCGLLDVVGREPYRSIRTTTIPTSLWPPATSSLPSTTVRHVAGELYIPTLSYRFRPTTPTGPDGTTMTPPECFSNPHQRREVQWELFDDSNQTTITNTSSPTPPPPQKQQHQQHRRLLIAITSGYDKYATMLTHTAHVAKLYASRMNQHQNRTVTVSVLVLQGMAFDPHRNASPMSSSVSSSCAPPPMQTTLNKIRLLFYAIDHARTSYDQLLLLDADALLVDWDYDISRLLIVPNYNDTLTQPLVAAQPCRFLRGRTRIGEGTNASIPQHEPYKINTGITLWNLHHPYIKPVAMAWFEESKTAVLQGIYQGDQRYLQMALSSHGRGEAVVVADDDTTNTTRGDKNMGIQHTTHEFNYRNGTVIQHFLPQQQRVTRDPWKDRLDQLIQAYQHLCSLFDCSQVPRKDYPTE